MHDLIFENLSSIGGVKIKTAMQLNALLLQRN